MSCDWCNYDLKLVYPNFEGYAVLNGYGEPIGNYCCSINCCVSQIQKLGHQVDIRLEQLYYYYNISGNVKPARDRKLLSKFGGNLSYSQFRSGFICPPPIYEEKYEEYDDYEFDDGDPYR